MIKNYGKFVRKERLKQGLTQQAVANLAGVSPSMVHSLETVNSSGIHNVEAVLNVLGYELVVRRKV